MLETRKRFHDELAALESEILGLGERAQRALEQAMQALVHKDAELVDTVVAEDDALDATYLDIEQRILNLLATQTPVATDLRLVSAILHANLQSLVSQDHPIERRAGEPDQQRRPAPTDAGEGPAIALSTHGRVGSAGLRLDCDGSRRDQ